MALNLYCKLPFGKLHKGNPLIVEVAAKMGRTSSSLAMKLTNFASLDPVLQSRGIRGLPNATKKDREYWEEFHANLEALGPESEQLLHDLFTSDDKKEVDFLGRKKVELESNREIVIPEGPTETRVTVRVRRGQQFFRQCILNAFGVNCCITGINVPDLLIASHIKPWNKFPDERLNPRNGLCLSRLHDAAFDVGLITLDENRCVVLSKRLKSFFPQRALEQNFVPYEGKAISEPTKVAMPDDGFLEYHRTSVFED